MFNDDDEMIEVLDDSSEQDGQVIEEPQYEDNKSINIRTPNQIKNDVGDRVENVGKTMETGGKALEKGGETLSKTGDALDKAGDVGKAAGNVTKGAGELADKGGQLAEGAGKAAKGAGKTLKAADAAATATGAAIGSVVPVAGTAAGAGVGKTVGTVAGAAGTGLDAAGSIAEGAGKGSQALGKAAKTAGDGLDKASDASSKLGSSLRTAGDKMSSAGKDLQEKGKEVADAGKKIKDFKTPKFGNESELMLKGVTEESKELVDKIKNLPIKIIIIAVVAIVLLIVLTFMGSNYNLFENSMQSAELGSEFYDQFDDYLVNFGFGSNEKLFYKEVNKLNNYYNEDLDIPLLMATVFYDDIEYGFDLSDNFKIEDIIDINDDKSVISYGLIEEYVKEIAGDSSSESGVKYSTGKIYRLRDLAKHMVKIKTSDQEEEVKVYYEKVAEMYGTNVKSQLSNWVKSESIPDNLKSLFDIITGKESFAYTSLGGTIKEMTLTQAEINTLMFSMFLTSTNIFDCQAEGHSGLCVYPEYYTFDEDAYFKYLEEEYIPKMPEFKDELSKYEKGSEEYNMAVNSIIDRICDISDDYYFLSGRGVAITDSVKFDSDYSTGQILPRLVSYLSKPVTPKDGFEIEFKGSNSYGINDKVQNNGIYLNSETIGAFKGDSVYSVYDGKIESLVRVSEGTSSVQIFDNYLFIGDSRYRGIENQLKGLGSNVYVAAVSSSTPKDFLELSKTGMGTIKTDGDQGTFTLPNSVKGISIMLGVNAIGQTKELQQVIQNLHSKYPDATIYINSVYHLGSAYKNSLTNDEIDKFNNTMKDYGNRVAYTRYIDVTSNLYDNTGKLKSELTKDGLHLNEEGKKILVENIKSLGGNTATVSSMIIKHEMNIGKSNYVFYSKYVYIDIDSGLSVGNKVTKGQKLGVIGSSGSLYFEFDDENGNSINPTNLYLSSSIELIGNTNEEKVFNYFISKGFTVAAASGILGNIAHEAGGKFEPVTLQVQDWKKYSETGIAGGGLTSQEFTDQVDAGIISYEEFLNSQRFGTSIYTPGNYGYGLVGFTAHSIKQVLWSKTYEKGISIGDLGAQLETIYETMSPSLVSTFETITDPMEAGWLFSSQYERCDYCVIRGSDGEKLREQDSLNYYNKYKK